MTMLHNEMYDYEASAQRKLRSTVDKSTANLNNPFWHSTIPYITQQPA